MKRIIYLFVLISGIAYGQNPVVIAHRGGSSMAPENTLAAYKIADSIHADYYELDVQISLDDSLMILHDASVDRTTDGSGNIASMTYAQLRLLDAGSWFGAKFTGEKIPTFREALAIAKNSTGNIGVVIELKSGETTLAAKAVAIIQSMGLQDKVIVSSFNLSQITQVKSLDSTIAVQLFDAITNTEINQVAAIGGEWVGSGGSFTQSIIDYAHSKGIKFNAWTINNASQMLSLFALGVDGITTDYPAVMMSIMDYSAPSDVVLTSVSAVESDITLNWESAEDTESGIAGYDIYRDITSPTITLLTTVGNVTEYIDKTFTEGQWYYYRIKAKNMAGMRSVNYSNEIAVFTQSDVSPPFIKYVTSSGDSVTIIIEFSERVNEATAQNPANYTINNEVTVQDAKLALDQKSVFLTASPLAEHSYLITIKDIQDKAITPNTMVTTTAIFRHKSMLADAVAIYNLDTLIDQSADVLVPDATKNFNHGKVKNGAFLAEGILGNAIGFDGVDDYIQFETSPSFDFNTNEVTISLWTKMDFLPTELPSAYGPLFDSETDQYVMYEDKANGELRFKVTTTDGAERPGIPNSDLTTGQWAHIVGVYNGTNAMIYLNGVLKDSHPLTGTVNKGQSATLGKSGTSYFKGSIDQVEIYSRALSEVEIMEKYIVKTPIDLNTSLIASPTIQPGFTIFPNPNDGQFTLALNSQAYQDVRLEVINALGQVVFIGKTDKTGKRNVQLITAHSGIYTIRMIAKSGIYKQRMIIK